MERERGSQATLTIKGGPNDGAVAVVLDWTDIEDYEGTGPKRIHLVRLPDGSIIEVARDVQPDTQMPREIGT